MMPFPLAPHARIRSWKIRLFQTVTWAGIVAIVPGLLSPSAASAQTTVQPEAGLDHYYKAQRWMPLHLTLTNQGAPAKVEVRARFASGSDGAQEYRLPEQELQASANRAHT